MTHNLQLSYRPFPTSRKRRRLANHIVVIIDDTIDKHFSEYFSSYGCFISYPKVV